MAESLKNQTIKNFGYNTLAKVFTVVFQGLANIILSQNLGASDYGIVGFAMIIVNFLSRFNDLGIQTAVVQRKELTDATMYTAFTAKAVLGLFVYLITFMVAGAAPYFFDNSAAVTVIRLVSLNFIINTFAFLPRVLLNRELNFKKISAAEACMSLTSSLTAVAMALLGFKYWSIVVATLASNLVGVLVFVCFRPVKIRIFFDKSIARELVKLGGNLFLAGMVTFVVFNADNFVVGSAAGSSALGYYALAFNWGSLVCTVLGDIVLSVLFPTFSKMQGDTERIKKAYLQVLEGVGFMAVLLNLTLFLGAEEFLYYLLGKGTDKWLPALATLKIMCCYGMVRALLEPVGSVVMAIGKTDLLLKANSLAAVIELVFIYPVIKMYGIEGVALLVSIAYLAQYFVYWPAIKKFMAVTAKDVCAATLPTVLPVVIIAGSFTIVREHVAPISIFLAIPLGVSLFIAMSGLLSGWSIVRQLKMSLIGAVSARKAGLKPPA
jgi:lipopolysaccharide exporter